MKSRCYMNNFNLKFLACVVMLIDHIGAVLFPDAIILRYIGRLAFPIFAFLISEGYEKTKSRKSYTLRLLSFAIISQIPYSIAFNTFRLNIFFTLLGGLGAIAICDYNFNFFSFKGKFELNDKKYKIIQNTIKSMIILGICILFNIINTDYSAYGILTILCFKLFKGNYKRLIFYTVIINLLNVDKTLNYYLTYNIPIDFSTFNQLFSILSLFIISKYNNKKGKSFKYGFYCFYPAHLILLSIIKII